MTGVAGRAYNSRAYRNARRRILASAPLCALRIRCDGAPATTVDHIIPVSMNGTNDQSNLRPACASCNYSRGNRIRTRSPLPW